MKHTKVTGIITALVLPALPLSAIAKEPVGSAQTHQKQADQKEIKQTAALLKISPQNPDLDAVYINDLLKSKGITGVLSIGGPAAARIFDIADNYLSYSSPHSVYNNLREAEKFFQVLITLVKEHPEAAKTADKYASSKGDNNLSEAIRRALKETGK